MPKYKQRGITLRDLRVGATPTGELTRPGEFMTATEAAKRLHISQPHLSNVESGRHKPGDKLLASMRTLYGVPLTVVYAAALLTAANVRPPRSRRKNENQ